MARPELGTKRLCSSCDAKFYDLNRDPVVCPNCGAQILLDGEPKPESKPAVVKPAEKPAPKDDETDDDEDVEIVSLEDVEEDDDDEDIPEIADVEIEEDDETKIEGDDDTFLEDDEEDGDVTGILGGGLSEKEEET